MFGLKNAPIKTKLSWLSTLATCVALLLASGAFLAYDAVNFREAMVRGLSTQADIIGYNSVSPLLFQDDSAAGQTLAALRADSHITSAAIYDRDGILFSMYVRSNSTNGFGGPEFLPLSDHSARFEWQTLAVSRTIEFKGERIGTVYIESDMDEWFARLQRYIGIGFCMLLISAWLGRWIASKLQRAFARPISRLVTAAKIVSQEQDYSVRVTAEAQDELGLLVETFNQMLSQIQERDTALQNANSEVERKVNERTDELRAANAEMEAFTYSVSHDLRAPLRRIDGFAQLLTEDYSSQLPEQAQDYLRRVRAGTRHMGQLVDELLNFSRIGRKNVERQVTGLNSLVAEILGELQEETRDRAIQWKLQDLPYVECDPALMKIVLTNLLSNAVKYSRPRQQAVIEVGSGTTNGTQFVFVRDNGVGFSMKYADKLFGVFQRLHRVEDFEGTGIGLATVQRIIHKHGGQIWAEAEVDRGACFSFTLANSIHTEPTEPKAVTPSGKVAYAERSN